MTRAPAPEPLPPFAFLPGERATLPAALAAHAERLARLVVAVDGPGGSGKSTTARQVAARLGLLHIDTGGMYRAATYAALRAGVHLEDGEGLARLLDRTRIDLETAPEGLRVLVDGEDVSGAIRGPEVTAAVSRVAAQPEVRSRMVERQRQLGAKHGVVLDGRDIGTVVFPRADVKVFLTADTATRAARRQREDAGRGDPRPLPEIEADLRRRDAEDSSRAVSPLACAPDAIVLDTTALDVAAQVDAVLALAVRAVRRHGWDGETRVRLDPVDLADWSQPGYRRFRSRLYRLVHDLLYALLRTLLGLRVVRHPAAAPTGAVLAACNHVAGLDPVVAGASLPWECAYVAKLELFRNPVFARLIGRFNAIPIRRGTADYAALDRAVALLGEGCDVFMFPEGTRQRPGRLGRARWGFGYVALRAGRPVVPVFVRGSRDRSPRPWRREPLEVWVGEPVVVRATAPGDDGQLYLEAGERIMERIGALMLRSAAGRPLQDLELPGPYAPASGPERTERAAGA